jgi:hypothetical protein
MGGNGRSRIAMANLRRSPAYILIIVALLGVLVGCGQATTTRLTVRGGEEVNLPINLVVEDRVLIQFTVAVIVGTTKTLHFSMIFPNSTVRDFGEVGTFRNSFICDVEGEYTLQFINNDQTGNKQVTLNYEVQHYVFGIPQMLFMTIIIVLACIGGVVAFVLLGKTY